MNKKMDSSERRENEELNDDDVSICHRMGSALLLSVNKGIPNSKEWWYHNLIPRTYLPPHHHHTIRFQVRYRMVSALYRWITSIWVVPSSVPKKKMIIYVLRFVLGCDCGLPPKALFSSIRDDHVVFGEKINNYFSLFTVNNLLCVVHIHVFFIVVSPQDYWRYIVILDASLSRGNFIRILRRSVVMS